MTKQQFQKWVLEGVRILDGATGTQLQQQGMPGGVSPEKWVLENPEAIIKIQKAYIDNGSDIIYTCTFGANGLKLREFGIDDVAGYNRALAQLSKTAAQGKALVAGDIAPTGQMMEPYGMHSFEEIVDIYKKQVQGLLEGGVDLFVIETMMDIQEARAALLAVKESCDLPVMVTMTFESGGHTLNGTDPVTALITLQSLGADAVGCNCSTGPKEMVEIIRQLKPYAKVPLIAKPNAGMPKLIDGKTVFDMSAQDFAGFAQNFVDAGVNLLGGCCGTTPEYIHALSTKVRGKASIAARSLQDNLILSSSRKIVRIGKNQPICVIGERINPTGNKDLRQQLQEGFMDLVTEYALDQVDEGAHVLYIHAGVPGVDEAKLLPEMVKNVCALVQAPLCLDSSSPAALEAALRIYPGRALINSISAEQKKLKQILPIAVKYGAAFMLLPLDDQGVPEKAEDRIRVAQNVFRQAQHYGYTKQDILIDDLVITNASSQRASMETLKVIQWAK